MYKVCQKALRRVGVKVKKLVIVGFFFCLSFVGFAGYKLSN